MIHPQNRLNDFCGAFMIADIVMTTVAFVTWFDFSASLQIGFVCGVIYGLLAMKFLN